MNSLFISYLFLIYLGIQRVRSWVIHTKKACFRLLSDRIGIPVWEEARVGLLRVRLFGVYDRVASTTNKTWEVYAAAAAVIMAS